MIVPKGLPLPTVRDGAIETIITNIIKQNEIVKRLDLTVVSLYYAKTRQSVKPQKY